jgi:NADH dehydrogenase FAD-containing subunit
MPEVASGVVSSRTARLRVDDTVDGRRVRVIQDRVVGLDLDRRVVQGAADEYRYDLLILAPGIEYRSPAGQWLPYQTVSQASRISRAVMSMASASVAAPDQQRILVQGDGVRALELATALSWACDDAVERRGVRLFRVSLWSRCAPDLGLSHVEAVEGDVDAALRIDAREGRSPCWLAETGLPLRDDGSIRVEDNLTIPGHHDVFAAGACAARSSGDPWPDTVLTTWQMGDLAADNVRMELVGASHGHLVPWPIDSVVRLGGNDGRANVLGVPLTGELARTVARMLVAGSIPTVPKKLAVVAEWLRVGRNGGDWALLTGPTANQTDH